MDVETIRASIRKKYAAVARSPEGRFRYPTGRDGAEALDYPADCLATAPAEAIEGFCGVGHPLGLGPVGEGEAVLDVGCGAGLDLWCAGRLVGPSGRLCGIDASPEMAARARRALAAGGLATAAVRAASVEEIPHADGSFDLVISNGVLNLSPEKERSYAELHRVLGPGGRLWFADVVLEADLPPEERTARAWSE